MVSQQAGVQPGLNNKEEVMNQWWGYIHTSGTVHVKRYFGPLDIREARESDFCNIVRGPVEAIDREDAISKLFPEYKEDK